MQTNCVISEHGQKLYMKSEKWKEKEEEEEYLRALSYTPSSVMEKMERNGWGVFQKKWINIDHSAEVFYKLVWLSQKMPEDRQIRRLKRKFDRGLALAMYDYLGVVVLGELRHSKQHIFGGRVEIEDFREKSENRHSKLSEFMKWERQSIFLCGEEVFGVKLWEKNFGGKSWKNICRVALKWGSMSDERWVDEVFHVRHNGGRLFDRGVIFEGEIRLREFLNKRECGEKDKDWEDEVREGSWKKFVLEEGFVEKLYPVLRYEALEFGKRKIKWKVEEGKIECEECGRKIEDKDEDKWRTEEGLLFCGRKCREDYFRRLWKEEGLDEKPEEDDE